MSKALKEIKRDLERAYIGVDNAAVTGTSSAAREMASATQQITTVEAGGTAALTETMLLNLGQTTFNNGSDPSVFLIKPADAQIVASFTGSAGRNRTFNDGNKTLVNVIDLYVN